MYVENVATVMEFDEAMRTLEIVGSRNGQLDVVMQIKTQRAGEIEGESERKFGDSKPRHDILGYYFSAGSPSDAGSGQAKGRRRYSALRVVRNSDAATASLMSAFATNDNLTVELASYRAGGDITKDTQPTLMIKLENARVKTFTLLSGGGLPNSGAVEIIELLFRSLAVDSAPQTHTGQRGAVRSFKDTLSE
jgi:type VI protein secretion system component Hcp